LHHMATNVDRERKLNDSAYDLPNEDRGVENFALMSETYKNEIRIRKRRFGNGFTQVTVVLGFRHHPELCHK